MKILFKFVLLVLFFRGSNCSKYAPFIAGGEEVGDGVLPYQTFLTLELNNNTVMECSGSLIKENVILTSATCVQGTRIGNAILGVSNIRNISPSITADVVVILETVVHEGFNSETLENNIALVILSRSARLKDGTIETIRIPTVDEDYVDIDAVVSGWGHKDSTYLKQVSVKTITNLSCRIRHENVFASNICSGSSELNTPCNDDGAPLVITERLKGKVQIGVFSYSAEDCSSGLPSVYTRLTSYIKWIEDNI